MRKSTLMLAVLFVLLLMCGILFLAGGTLSGSVSVAATSASEYPQAFESIGQVLASGGTAQRFSEAMPANAEDCRLEVVTLSLHNPGLVSAEWLSVSVEGAAGDVAVYSVDGEGDTVPGRGDGSLTLKIVARADGAGDRRYQVQYYVFGMKRSLTLAAD